MKSALLFLICCLASGSLLAQWTTDTEINTTVASSATGDMMSVGTSDGKTYVAFWHDVPAPQYYEMRLQLLDENGNRLFGEEGMLVNNTVPMSSFTTLWSVTVDRENNVYIGFNGTDGGNPVHVHKISPEGTQLWGAAGINPGSGFDPKILPLSNGEVIVCWLPGNKGVMQKVSADGAPLWASPVTIEPTVASHKTSAGELAEMSNGDVVVILHDRGGFSPSSLPYAQRYTSTGATVWSAPVALTTTYFTSFNRRYALRKDGDVLYFGYSGAQGIQPHGFLQRINPDGTLPWGINGSDFSTQTSAFERDVQIAFEEGSHFVWAICEYSDASQSNVGEFVQKFDKETGSRQLSNTGKEVFPVSAAYISHQGDLEVVNDQPVFLVSDGNSNGVFAKDLLAVYLDGDGEFAWPEQTRPVATNTSGVKSRIHLNAPHNGRVVAAWAEDRPGVGASRPYAQQVEIACSAPSAGFTYTISDLTVTFSSTVSGADSIAWDFGDGTFGDGDQAAHVYAAAGTYTVCHSAHNACGESTICQPVTILTNGVSFLESVYHLNVSPNPNRGDCFLNIEIPKAAGLSYQLLSASGQVMEQRSVVLGSGRQSIPIHAGVLPPGTYVLAVKVDGKKAVLPMIMH